MLDLPIARGDERKLAARRIDDENGETRQLDERCERREREEKLPTPRHSCCLEPDDRMSMHENADEAAYNRRQEGGSDRRTGRRREYRQSDDGGRKTE